VSNIIPRPWSDQHDELMKKFHEQGTYHIVDKRDLVLYFLHKNGHILEGRLLVKVVPKNNSPPFFMVIVKPTPPKHELILVEKVEKVV
jgi:hypothetical protein